MRTSAWLWTVASRIWRRDVAKEDRQTLEDIASDMGATRVSEMTDAELIDYITK